MATRVSGGAGLLALLVVLMAPALDLGWLGGMTAAAQGVGAVDPTQALAAADPISDGPPPLGALVAGILLLVGLAVSARRGA